jgi:hypothetical protein
MEAINATKRSRDRTRRNERLGEGEDERGNNPKEELVV